MTISEISVQVLEDWVTLPVEVTMPLLIEKAIREYAQGKVHEVLDLVNADMDTRGEVWQKLGDWK